MRIRLSIIISLANLVASGALAAGCTGATDPKEESASVSTDDAAMRDAPAVGTCWRVPPESVIDQDYWFDDSPQVPCTEPHTTETVRVDQLEEPTVEEAEKIGASCWNLARGYVDVTHEHWVPWAMAMFLPSSQQVADGASFARCEVFISGNLANSSVRSVNYSAAFAATERADEILPCLDRDPDMREQPYVSCGRPHRYEATGQLAGVVAVDGYPSAKVLRSEQEECRRDLSRRHDTPDHGVTAAWDPPEWFEGTQLAGVCFVYRPDGNLLPARR